LSVLPASAWRLHYVLVGAMYLVSAISGSKASHMAAVAPVLLPEMKPRGASPGDLVAPLAATDAQTETIPPSLVPIAIGSVTGLDLGAVRRSVPGDGHRTVRPALRSRLLSGQRHRAHRPCQGD
jgi:TRAP-type C4-dicarboxylate transport system permease large subunit